jgi:hypothetical protein
MRKLASNWREVTLLSCAARRWRAVKERREKVITRPSEPPVARRLAVVLSWIWQTRAVWPVSWAMQFLCDEV